MILGSSTDTAEAFGQYIYVKFKRMEGDAALMRENNPRLIQLQDDGRLPPPSEASRIFSWPGEFRHSTPIQTVQSPWASAKEIDIV